MVAQGLLKGSVFDVLVLVTNGVYRGSPDS